MSTEAMIDHSVDATPTAARRLPLWAWPVGIFAAIAVLSLVRLITGRNDIASSGTLSAALALAMPIAFAGLGGLWSERSGVINIGLEGMMVLGTWGGAYGALIGGPWAGILMAAFCGAVGGLIHALATVTFGVDHIVSGVAINIVAVGAASFLAARFFGDLDGGSDVQSPPVAQPPKVGIPGIADPLSTIEQKGWFFLSELAALLKALTTGLSALTVIGLALFVLTFYVLWRTPFGLRIRSCGESPTAAESLGVNVYLHKYLAVTISGALAGLGGGFLSMVATNIYRESQVDGRGYIGLAAMIFGNWRPGGLLMGSGLFGFMDALQLRGGGAALHALLLLIALLLLALGLWQIIRRGRTIQGAVAIAVAIAVALIWVVTDSVPGDITPFAPHLTTLLVLAFASQRLRPPKSIGQVYRKGEGH
ncbi:ABC transporter permease [Marihabitans asiaticum]|uniref:Nucleoside ABC transporter membrane protein n=1 Tax=Marihabitans asiaticum TaxID=415218 RepID=A0A560WCR3_9MICO|nr:ABC transporter permease [Marihabitans asiaticum]TWD15483.1 nucleoside ABC transporter membrane protein [Marihabitans asiaticum]